MSTEGKFKSRTNKELIQDTFDKSKDCGVTEGQNKTVVENYQTVLGNEISRVSEYQATQEAGCPRIAVPFGTLGSFKLGRANGRDGRIMRNEKLGKDIEMKATGETCTVSFKASASLKDTIRHEGEVKGSTSSAKPAKKRKIG